MIPEYDVPGPCRAAAGKLHSSMMHSSMHSSMHLAACVVQGTKAGTWG